ncbi:MAG: selenocysteine-specific translation elongation factor [Oscillospiraceae bacterium]|nr:selenocysteine-specific translation elongation factor [Oscillospiraceae bacterium]
MKHIVIGTAGHIDHGKTRLTQALTGVDTDSLPAERAQGITIDLGFAPLVLPCGVQASIVDVPGHEKFVKNMLAGATGIDAALLVIAADDGVMPQTREHLDILKLLGVRFGVVALTKTDLVSPERLEQAKSEIAQLTEGSFLQDAPILPVSAATGDGLDALREALSHMAGQIQAHEQGRPLRLPVDRVFSTEGQGVVSTGTVVDGKISIGDAVMIYPQQKSARVRALQVHGVPCEQISAGTRAAVILAGAGTEDLSRGCTIAAPDSMLVTELADVWIQITGGCPYKIRNSSQLHIYCGTQEGVCKLRLLNADFLTAGQSGWAQLKLTKPMTFRNRDVFILRFFSPMLTIGGGMILESNAVRLRRNRPEVLQRLARLNSDDPAERLLQRLNDSGCIPTDPARLARYCNVSPEGSGAVLSRLQQCGHILPLENGSVLSERMVQEKAAQLQEHLAQWQSDYPLMPGMPVARLREQSFRPQEAAEQILRSLTARGALQVQDGFVSLPGFTAVFTQQHKIMQRKLLHYYRDAWFAAPDRKVVDEKFAARGALYTQVMRHMLFNRLLIPLSPRYAVHHEAYAQACALLQQLTENGVGVTLGQFHTETGTSRKYAQLFLEHWDSIGYTRRVGDAHFRL